MSGKINLGSPGSTFASKVTPYLSTWNTIVAIIPNAIITTAIGNLGITFLEIIRIANAPTPNATDTQLICCAVSYKCFNNSGSSPEPDLPPMILGICIKIIVNAIPLINPPITGVEINVTSLPAFKK